MTQPTLRTPALDARARAALATEFARALESPGLRPLLPRLTGALLPRFAPYYDQLLHLPRRTRRALQRQWKRSLAALALLLALGQAPALAATIDVDGSTCTLVDAITAANTDTATGGCLAGAGADTLTLTNSSVHTLTAVNNPIYGLLRFASISLFRWQRSVSAVAPIYPAC